MNKRIIFIIVCLLAAIGAVAQEKIVTGTIYDELNDPFPGVVIQPKDRPGVGISTDIDGNFSIKVQKKDVLVISCLGYATQEIDADEVSGPLSITMTPASTMLDEAVVVGLGTQRKISVVGAVTSVNVDQLQTPATNLQNMLGGRVPGVISIQKSGEPGKNISDFWIRGIGTFGANSSALVLIDGLEGNLSELDPADVEIIRAAAKDTQEYEKQKWAEKEASAEQIVRDAGCTITELTEEAFAQFQAAMTTPVNGVEGIDDGKSLYEMYGGAYQDVIDAIKAVGEGF